VALYRLEYQRWNVEDALREMHSYDFGRPVPIQDHNLRTYLPRPLPGPEEWAALQDAFGERLDRPVDYAAFIRRLRQARAVAEVGQAVESYVEDDRPFSLCLAHRLIDRPDDPLVAVACQKAADCLWRSDAAAIDWAIAAALVADFGEPAQQQQLLALLASEPRAGAPSARYQAIVRGVTNRYTANRIPFLRPIIDDLRPRVEREAVYQPDKENQEYQPYRYCDTAVARLCTILDRHNVVGPTDWEASRQEFLRWFAEHEEVCQPGRLGDPRFNFSREKKASGEDRDDYR
jgi:hypothetical protein